MGNTRAPDNDKLVDSMILINAIEFASAADAYAVAGKLRDWFVLYFQFGQSFELTLKAFAIHVGATEKYLIKNLGHDLVAALQYAEQNGLIMLGGLSGQDRDVIKLVSKWHQEQLTRYPLLQSYSFPNPRIVRDLLNRLLCSVFCAIWGEGQYKHELEHKKTKGLLVDIEAIYGT